MSAPRNVRRHPAAAPVEDVAADARFWDGVERFNSGDHWHAHESWEPVWMGLEGEEKLALQGLIMAAAMLHQYARGVRRGVTNHWDNLQARLLPAPRWGLDIPDLLEQLAPYAADAARDAPLARDPAQVRLRRLAH